ncbi:HAD family hydrolase [Nocardioides panzhihuensis]|uniref:Beta-phosphoglucomutase-like phosphatase (HAD superfamily) n=1 Tax=Nocardioides panzhihuensis TaxID=860243 RepID=A0A7Z0DNC4_9ACTN|nr:HAD-IA family hydrolase [Nocardioides panzhihuensis]NYI78809.1 beta-phosphoglucomutase-like phosphatase (HAD superfamily) [Nocardioides panzhihuensis]
MTTAKRADFDIIHPKPHPEPYLAGLKRFGAAQDETLVVEDSSRGLASAVAAGIDCAVVRNSFTAPQDLSRATHRIDALTELASIVRGCG